VSTFEYRGFDRAGRRCRGLVEAAGVKAAREKLAADGLLADRVTPTARRFRLPDAVRSVLYRELAALLGAGLPLAQALELLIETPETRDAGRYLAAVRDRVRDGARLADAWADAGATVSDFERSLLAAAERTSTVEPMLERLAEFLEARIAVRQRVRAALAYPAVVLAVGVAVAILMLGVLLPRTRELMGGGLEGLPAVTLAMIHLGAWLKRWGVLAALLPVGAAVLVRMRAARDERLRLSLHRAALRVPLAGKASLLLLRERFCRTLALLLEGGVPAVDALALSGKATGNRWVAARLAESAEEVRHGASLSSTIQTVEPLADSLPGWLKIGEAGGGLGRLLNSAAHRYHAQWDRYVKLCLSFLEPVLILGIGVFVLLVTLAVLLPVFTLSRAL